jgi:hypothetical protein
MHFWSASSGCFAKIGIQSFPAGDVQELLENGTDLSRGDSVNPEPATRFDAKIVLAA